MCQWCALIGSKLNPVASFPVPPASFWVGCFACLNYYYITPPPPAFVLSCVCWHKGWWCLLLASVYNSSQIQIMMNVVPGFLLSLLWPRSFRSFARKTLMRKLKQQQHGVSFTSVAVDGEDDNNNAKTPARVNSCW